MAMTKEQQAEKRAKERAEHDRIKAIVEATQAEFGLDTYIVTEDRDGKEFALHQLTLPGPRDKGRYIANMSMQYFEDRELKRWSPVWRAGKTLPFTFCHWDRLSSLMVMCRTVHGHDWTPDLPLTVHASLWDFYKAIGYDYKRQKYDRTGL